MNAPRWARKSSLAVLRKSPVILRGPPAKRVCPLPSTQLKFPSPLTSPVGEIVTENRPGLQPGELSVPDPRPLATCSDAATRVAAPEKLTLVLPEYVPSKAVLVAL